jgi:hypothetical protein
MRTFPIGAVCWPHIEEELVLTKGVEGDAVSVRVESYQPTALPHVSGSQGSHWMNTESCFF